MALTTVATTQILIDGALADPAAGRRRVLVNPATGRVHAAFNQTVTATGRLSSSDPNLQNIPVRREQGQQIRQAFIPAEGWTLITADYSQIELRLLAHFSGDSALRQAFAEDRDIHTAVAAQVFGVAEKDVTREMRRVAKTVNFGVIYGISPHGLAPRRANSSHRARVSPWKLVCGEMRARAANTYCLLGRRARTFPFTGGALPSHFA